ncbi:MAG: glycoside hydrolase 5 family protein [Planctomycetota bacterium]|jgi:endo-1,4-beta-mannosidase
MKRSILLLSILTAGVAIANTELGTDGRQLTINGKPTFLVGISYYGALGAPRDFIQRDLDDMQKYGFNWFRVWATWGAFDNEISAVDRQGWPREPYLAKLQWLVAECDRRGMIVDVTLSRGNGVTGSVRLQSAEALRRAAKTLVASLKPYRNWYLDMGNERNIRDKRFVSVEELAQLRKFIKRLDPDRLVTASFVRDVKTDELKQILLDVRVDFLAPHRPRNPKSPGQTKAQTKKYYELTEQFGRTVPVHYQEPFRRGFRPERWEPKAEHFLADLKGALEGGAAGWCFHNGDQKDKPQAKPRRSFDMRKARLFEQLDEQETKFIRKVKAVVSGQLQ